MYGDEDDLFPAEIFPTEVFPPEVFPTEVFPRKLPVEKDQKSTPDKDSQNANTTRRV